MNSLQLKNFISSVLTFMPKGWLGITTHRLDIYEEDKAKVQFLDHLETLYHSNEISTEILNALPTAYDYIRLGHPLSCVLEWTIAKMLKKNAENIISFASETMPILAVLRHQLFQKKNTQILYTDALPKSFDEKLLKEVYGYQFETKKISDINAIPEFNGSTLLLSYQENISNLSVNTSVDFNLNIQSPFGSILVINSKEDKACIDAIQHLRRRETIAMTPADCFSVLNSMVGKSFEIKESDLTVKNNVIQNIKSITGTELQPLVGSSGLSIQYAIMMGLVDYALENYKGKAIKFIVPPNCYGGTNDQTRRVAACLDNVSIVDFPVDAGNDMVKSIETILNDMAKQDAIPFIIAEIPTNPRVEVPNLNDLKTALSKKRVTPSGEPAVAPVFILDQTFCPNVKLLKAGNILSDVKTVAFASGSKFPSGGKCTSGYCVVNKPAKAIQEKIELHLSLCDNEATPLQYQFLAEQLPSMNQRISDAYKNTVEFVNHIKQTLPKAKINFVSPDLAALGFTPSVFSLDLPTKGNTVEEQEIYKRALNLKLINLMITKIPNESKFCVSYGQLKGCYWTVPATSTQGTTKETDKDYIVRASLSPNLDLEKHKAVFSEFVDQL